MPCGGQECSADSRGAGRPKQHSQGNCNPVKNPAVSDVKLIQPLTRGEELSLGGEASRIECRQHCSEVTAEETKKRI